MWRINHIVKIANAVKINTNNTAVTSAFSTFRYKSPLSVSIDVRYCSKKHVPDGQCPSLKVKSKKTNLKLEPSNPIVIPPYSVPQKEMTPEEYQKKLFREDCEYPYTPKKIEKCDYDESTPPPKQPNKDYTMIGVGILLASCAFALFGYKSGLFSEKRPEKKLPPGRPKKKIVFHDPPSSKLIPDQVNYLLIGGGTASFAAFRSIKSADPKAKVLVISNEPYFPYMRPPLSKELWLNDDKEAVKKLTFKQWNGSERNLFYEPQDFYIAPLLLRTQPNGGVAVARGWQVNRINPDERIAYLEDGKEIKYNKCLIATGAKPKVPKVFQVALNADPCLANKVKVFRNITDFQEVYEAIPKSKEIAIIGGGFTGSELACAIAKNTNKEKVIYQVIPEKGALAKILPEYLSIWTTEKIRDEGVKVLTSADVIGVKEYAGKVQLIMKSNQTIAVDHVIIATGVEPNTELAKESGLEVAPDNGGFLVNSELQARTDLYIAGDCACFYDSKLGRRRIEHHDNAVVTGRLAGENMAGGSTPYTTQSMFWSDLGPNVGFEAVGVTDSSLPTVGVFAKSKDSPTIDYPDKDKCNIDEPIQLEKKYNEDFSKGVIFYLRNDIVVGIVLWNVFNRMSVARQVLKNESKYDDLNEVAKLFNIHED